MDIEITIIDDGKKFTFKSEGGDLNINHILREEVTNKNNPAQRCFTLAKIGASHEILEVLKNRKGRIEAFNNILVSLESLAGDDREQSQKGVL